MRIIVWLSMCSVVCIGGYSCLLWGLSWGCCSIFLFFVFCKYRFYCAMFVVVFWLFWGCVVFVRVEWWVLFFF